MDRKLIKQWKEFVACGYRSATRNVSFRRSFCALREILFQRQDHQLFVSVAACKTGNQTGAQLVANRS